MPAIRWPFGRAARTAAPEAKQSAAGPLIAFSSLGRPKWTPRDYAYLAVEGVQKNPVAYRCIRMIAEAAASAPFAVFVDGRREDDQPAGRICGCVPRRRLAADLCSDPPAGGDGRDLILHRVSGGGGPCAAWWRGGSGLGVERGTKESASAPSTASRSPSPVTLRFTGEDFYMGAQAGKDILLKIEGATGVFTTVAGLRARTISLNARTVDATDGDSAGRWRELLAGAGVKSAAVSGQGIFRDAASDALIREAFFDQSARTWRLVVPDFGVLEGPFLVAALEYAGEHEGEATFAVSLASAGQVGFSAV